MQEPQEIAEQISASEEFKGLTVDDLGLSVEDMMVAAIEADRAQRDAGEDDPIIPANEDFPDRPQHLDFGRLSAAMIATDALADGEGTPPEKIGIDDASLHYAVTHRTENALEKVGPLAIVFGPEIMLAGSWIDGFAVGMEYQRRGGNRPGDQTGTAGDKEGSE